MDTTVHDRIRQQVTDNPVVLFMKGTPVFPQCGFSATVVQILSHIGVKFKGIDVLADSSVREGIKEDICDSVFDQPSQASGKLPPFGAGFVRGIASNAIDSAVTPEALASAAQQSEAASVPQGASATSSRARLRKLSLIHI